MRSTQCVLFGTRGFRCFVSWFLKCHTPRCAITVICQQRKYQRINNNRNTMWARMQQRRVPMWNFRNYNFAILSARVRFRLAWTAYGSAGTRQTHTTTQFFRCCRRFLFIYFFSCEIRYPTIRENWFNLEQGIALISLLFHALNTNIMLFAELNANKENDQNAIKLKIVAPVLRDFSPLVFSIQHLARHRF